MLLPPYLRHTAKVLLETFDAHVTHKNFRRHNEDLTYHRLDTALVRVPGILDLQSIRSLEASLTHDDLTAVHFSLVASSFYFALSTCPIDVGHGVDHCEGFIRPRGDSREVLKALKALKPRRISFTAITPEKMTHRSDVGSSEWCDPNVAACSDCKRWGMKVRFNVRRSQSFAIWLLILQISVNNASRPAQRHVLSHKISGFPTTVEDLAKLQQLDHPFRVEHRMKCSACS